MTVEMHWHTASHIAEKKGLHEFLMLLMKAYPQLGLYAVSMDWLKGPQFPCKAKGVRGDVLIQWRRADDWTEDMELLELEGI